MVADANNVNLFAAKHRNASLNVIEYSKGVNIAKSNLKKAVRATKHARRNPTNPNLGLVIKNEKAAAKVYIFLLSKHKDAIKIFNNNITMFKQFAAATKHSATASLAALSVSTKCFKYDNSKDTKPVAKNSIIPGVNDGKQRKHQHY